MIESLWIRIHSLAQESFWRNPKYISSWDKMKETLSSRETGAVEKTLMHIISLKYKNYHRILEFSKELDILLLRRVRRKEKKRNEMQPKLGNCPFYFCATYFFKLLFLGQHQEMCFTQTNEKHLTLQGKTGIG